MKAVNLELDRNYNTTGKECYTVKAFNKDEPSGFSNKFNVFRDRFSEKQWAELMEMLESSSPIYAFPDGRCKSGYNFVQY